MRSAMKPHELITPWKGDKRYTDIARRAAALKKAGSNAEQIVATITTEFGAPAQLLGLRDVPAPAHVFGTVGDNDTPAGVADIEAGAYAQLQLALRLPIAERGALLPDAHLPDDQIEDSPYQARRLFDEQSVEELAQGMRESGFQGVLIVRPH